MPRQSAEQAIEKIGARVEQDIVKWLIYLADKNPVLTWEIENSCRTVIEEGNLARIDVQGNFYDRTNGERWINVQLQHKNATLVTLFVQRAALNNNHIRTATICRKMRKAMCMRLEPQTLFLGNTYFKMSKEELRLAREGPDKRRFSMKHRSAASFIGHPDEIPPQCITLKRDMKYDGGW